MSDNGPQDGRKAGVHGEEMVLTFLFGVLLAGVLGVLAIDYRALTGTRIPVDIPFLHRTESVPAIEPARDNDQVRPYSPQIRVDFGPDGVPSLPGVAGSVDAFMSGSMTFHRAGAGVVTAIGFIEPGTAIRFEEFVARERQGEKVKTLYLHSPGGSVRDAIEMARFIRSEGIKTVITRNGYCASSCPLAFAGGVERSVSKPSALGVHQVFTSDAATGTLQQGIANAQAISAEAQELLIEMGVDPRAWIQAMATPKDRLYLFTDKEIAALKWSAR